MNLEEQLLQKEADLKTACELGLYLTQQNQELQTQLEKEKSNQLVIEQEYIKMESELNQAKQELNLLREQTKKQKAIIDKNQDLLIQMEIENKEFTNKLTESEDKTKEIKQELLDLELKYKEILNEKKMLEIEIEKQKQVKTREQIKVETVEIIKHVDNREEINALLETIEEYKSLYEEAIQNQPIEEQRLITSNLPQQSLFSQLQVKKERRPVQLKLDLDLVSQLKSEIQELNQKIEVLEKMNSYGLANNNEDEIKYLRMCKIEENNRNIELLKQIKMLTDEINELKKEKEQEELIGQEGLVGQEELVEREGLVGQEGLVERKVSIEQKSLVIKVKDQQMKDQDDKKENKQELINDLVKQIHKEKENLETKPIDKPERKRLKIDRQTPQECNQQ
ncbi:hypothetical protein HK103_002253 [Boothiomyces macroporosus]|uniref:Uncharacterized protein n=1 Tax=Boothiomyces macroporosus TaxID=261099 RepID=A0AAD5U9R2_9FUNG|nr:hypothetical protein HK103_002253 [Boothiomyces macroporosus]